MTMGGRLLYSPTLCCLQRKPMHCSSFVKSSIDVGTTVDNKQLDLADVFSYGRICQCIYLNVISNNIPTFYYLFVLHQFTTIKLTINRHMFTNIMNTEKSENNVTNATLKLTINRHMFTNIMNSYFHTVKKILHPPLVREG